MEETDSAAFISCFGTTIISVSHLLNTAGVLMQSKSHWEGVYSTKQTNTVSCFQEHAQQSLRLTRATGVPLSASIIDVRGGASTLVDDLLSDGYLNLTVLDLSAAAIDAARNRLGAAGQAVKWLVADITSADLLAHTYEAWHDRAVFHFLTSPDVKTSLYQNDTRRSQAWRSCHRRHLCRRRTHPVQRVAGHALQRR